MFKFEISIGGGSWEEIPEEVFYDSLYRFVNKVTPYIRDMLSGQIVSFGNRNYRITRQD
jgi:hypothetical protein